MRTHLLLLAVAACHRSPDPAEAVGSLPITIPVGTNPVDLAAGDLDGDGRLDLVSADAGTRGISVRLQRDAAWLAGETVAVDVEPHLLALGDVDGDRDLDLIVTSHDSGTVMVRLNDGKARFRAAPGSPFAAFNVPKPHNHGLVVGDLDHDGDDDVVVVDQEQRAAVSLLADRGRLTAGAPIALGAQAYPPALGDLDGDQNLDLAVPLVGSNTVATLLGDGKGNFVAAPGSPYRAAHARPYAIALADLDRDGSLDAVVPHDDTNDISILLGDGTGRLRPAAGSPVSPGLRVGRPSAVDLDGDGTPDLVANGSGSLVVLRGDGRGGLRLHAREPAGGWRVIAADLDGKGLLDFAAPESDANALRVWLR